MSNRLTLAQMRELKEGQLERLPLDQIAALLEDVDAERTGIKLASDALQAELHRRYGSIAADIRRATVKDTGSVTLSDEGFSIRADLPKKIVWDQAKLQRALDAAIDAELIEDPLEYISYDIKVSETKYNAWPSKIRAAFDPARTVGVGSPTYRLTATGKVA